MAHKGEAMTVIAFKPRQDVRLSPRRLARRPLAPVVPLMRNADALYRLACTVDDDNPERGALMYQAVLLSHPGHARAMVNLGNIRFRQGREKEAKELYERARSIDPRCKEAAYNLGYLALEDGEVSDAIALLEIAIKLDPGFQDAHWNLKVAKERLSNGLSNRS